MAAGKMSRNRSRKAAYAALADKGSRNQEAIEGPIVGHFEEVYEMRLCNCDERTEDFMPDPKCHRCHGKGEFIRTDANDQPIKKTVIVHTSKAEAPSVQQDKAPKRATDARKLRRQEAAWGRCKGHEFGGKVRTDPSKSTSYDPRNCNHCGCPASAVAAEG